MATAAVDLPLSDGFTTNSVSDTVIGTDKGWMAASNTYGTVTNGLSGHPGNVCELNTANGSLSNVFQNTATDGTNIIDVDMLFTRWQDEDPPIFPSDVQVGLWANSNGYLTLYHSTAYPIDSYNDTSNSITVLTNMSALPTDEWVNVRITMDYVTVPPQGMGSWTMMTIQTNGGAAITSDFPVGISQITNIVNALTSKAPGAWVICANEGSASANLAGVAFAGKGFFDNFSTIDANAVFRTITLVATPAAGGVLTTIPGLSVADGTLCTTYVAASNHWFTTDITSNGVSMGSSSTQFSYIANADVTWTGLFQMVLSDSNTPAWWLDQTVGDTNAALVDTDNDGLLNWQEWLASTDPADSNSVFGVITVQRVGGSNVLTWSTSDVDPALPPYGIQYNTNLVAGAGWTWVEDVPRTNGTVIWQATAPGNNQVFYRVVATN